LESLDWHGVCKNDLQNLEPTGVRGQNLELKELTGFFESGFCTASALTMICSLSFRVKVRCHMGGVEKLVGVLPRSAGLGHVSHH